MMKNSIKAAYLSMAVLLMATGCSYSDTDSDVSTVETNFNDAIDTNPKCATLVEMRALEAHLGVEKRNGYSSFPMVPQDGIGDMGLNDRG